MSESLRLPWRDERPRSSSEQDAATSSDAEHDAQEKSFIVHKVQRHDTLAGIAIKYSVPIADVKRFNGLLSDTAMHARGRLLIPKQLEPVSDEVRSLFLEVATGLGRNPVLHTDAAVTSSPAKAGGLPLSTLPVSVPQNPFDRAPVAGRASAAPWWCQCGSCSEEADMAYTCPQSTFNQLNGACESLTPPSEPAGSARFHEQMCRRSRTTHEAGSEEGIGAALRSWASDLAQEVRGSRFGLQTGSAGGVATSPTASVGGGVFSSIGKAIRESAVIQKLKESAAAGASGRSGDFAGAADGIIASLRQGLLPKGNPPQFRVTGSPRSITGSAFKKFSAKCE